MAFWTYHIIIDARRVTVSAPDRARAPTIRAETDSVQADLQTPVTPPPPAEPVLALNGVVRGVGESFAIINGTIVRLGETIEDATLLRVDSGMAIVRRKGKDLILRTAK